MNVNSIIYVIKRFKPHLKPFQFYYGIIFIILIASSLSTIWMAQLLQQLFDSAMLGSLHNSIPIMIKAIFVYVLGEFLFPFLQNYVSSKFQLNLLMAVQTSLYKQIQSLTLAEIHAKHSTNWWSVIEIDAEKSAEFFVATLMSILFNILKICFIMGYLLWINWQLSLIILGAFMLITGLLRMLSRVLLQIADQKIAARVSLSAYGQDTMAALPLIKAFTAEKATADKITALIRKYKNIRWREAILYALSNAFSNVAISLAILLCLSLGGWYIGQGLLTIGGLIAFLKLMVDISHPVQTLSQLSVSIPSSVTAIERCLSVNKLQTEASAQAQSSSQTADLIANWNNGARLIVKDVSFSYGTGQFELKNINLKIEKTNRIAILGENGSGKSSLMKLLLQFYQPSKGRILFGDVDIQHLHVERWRSLFAYVPQDPFILHGSFRENILLGNPDASDDELQAAIALSRLEALINDSVDGLDTFVGERGSHLSGGQKQRIALARACIKKAPIFLFDELDASLDAAIKQDIMRLLSTDLSHHTVLMITHDLSSIPKDWQIIHINQGEHSIQSAL